MYIKQLEITNLQKHAHLVLNFTSGVNVIYGKTDAGKSCVRRAIEWLFFNKTLRNDAIRKDGTKKTSVKVILDNGDSIERIKSNTLNRYVLIIKEETKEFNSIGKTIPDEVLKVLKTTSLRIDGEEMILNVASQIALPFLLDKSATFRMKLFNKITGHDIIDKVLKSFNKDLLTLSRKERDTEEDITEKEEQLEKIKIERKQIQEIYNKSLHQYDNLNKKFEQYNKLLTNSKKLTQIKKGQILLNKELDNIPNIKETLISNLNNLCKKFLTYTELIQKYIEVQRLKREIKNTLSSKLFSDKCLKDLKDKREVYDKLIHIKSKCEKTDTQKEKTLQNISDLKKEELEWIIKYKNLLKQSGVCPTCFNEINDDTLKGISL